MGMVMITSCENYSTIKEAYLSNIRKVLCTGDEVVDERGSKTLEVSNLHTTIQFSDIPYLNPYNERIRGCVWTGGKLQSYREQLLNPNPQGFVYTYGERLCGFDVNQIQHIIDRLRDCRESRRATAVTIRPQVDCVRDEIPCLTMLDFKIRNNKMTVTGVWRSHDIAGAFYPNLHGIYHVADYVARYVGGVKVNCMEIHSISAHIYENDIEYAERILEMNK